MTTVTTTYISTDASNDMAELLCGVSQGDPASWNEIIRRYRKLVSATVRSYRLQEADALDAVQMTWLRLAENAHKVRLPERLGGWLATTARHECLYILRQAKAAAELSDNETEVFADPSAGPEQNVVEADTARIVWALVGELPARQQTVLRALFTDQPRPYAEAARATGMPTGGLGPTRMRALRQLRNKLSKHELGLVR